MNEESDLPQLQSISLGSKALCGLINLHGDKDRNPLIMKSIDIIIVLIQISLLQFGSKDN